MLCYCFVAKTNSLMNNKSQNWIIFRNIFVRSGNLIHSDSYIFILNIRSKTREKEILTSILVSHSGTPMYSIENGPSP